MATLQKEFESTLNLGSDSDDSCVTEIVEEHLRDLKSKIIGCLSESDRFSAYIIHKEGQPAKMVFTLGEKKTKPENIKSMPTKATNKLLVKNVPPSSDKEHLQMFFEYERGQGGGRVRQVKINDDRSAIIEFEEAKSVGVVLRKAPIKMLGETVEVKAFVPYLDYGETLDSINLKGFPAELIEEIATLNLKSEKSLNRELKVGDRVRVKRSVKTPFYEWGSLDITHESVGIIHSFGVIDGKNQMLVNFPTFQNWSADPDEMELVN